MALRVIVLSAAACGSEPGYDTPSDRQAPAGPVIQHEQSTIPAALVGLWNGGSNNTGHWYYEFGTSGEYRAWPAYVDNPQVLTGIAVVRSDTLTLSNGGSPVTYRWSISDGILYLDGFSYVRT